ncbi:MAG: pimeloyl-ACP methyl esterase BioG family protein [Cetobacterium sp.]|uniref:pimeloyl-ACP methyl esterase BioG family protein n=1 Tax=Cetobacterium sp. TaxID=2071632 RepID=UPI0025D7F179|nr:pimeloyl-ACP methyl esterase BioG family protein [uncultured Cetobacterium sp.]
MKLIIFFNGWGIKSLNFSVGNGWKIRYLNYPYKYEYEEVDLEYKKIIFVGWSFGVYYLNKFLEENPSYRSYETIGINGTPHMIGERGISKKMLEYTLENLTEESLERFYKNIGILDNKNISIFDGKKAISELKIELLDFIDNYIERENYIKKAIISKNDRIIKFKNQKKYFTENGSLIYEIDGEHFIFNEKKFVSRLVDILDEI